MDTNTASELDAIIAKVDAACKQATWAYEYALTAVDITHKACTELANLSHRLNEVRRTSNRTAPVLPPTPTPEPLQLTHEVPN